MNNDNRRKIGFVLSIDDDDKNTAQLVIDDEPLYNRIYDAKDNDDSVRIENRRGGYLYINFFDNLNRDIDPKFKREIYTQSLIDQYEIVKKKIGKDAHDSLRDFISFCFRPGFMDNYYISMPAFEREIESATNNYGKTNTSVRNVVIRPDLSSTEKRSYTKIPAKYDLIIVGDITFGSVTSFRVKGIDLIDSETVKYGEYKVTCYAVSAFSKKLLPSGTEVLDYGTFETKSPVLTIDFIKSLCENVYPVPNHKAVERIIDRWKGYIDFRKYYLGVQSEKSEEITDVEAVCGYMVSQSAYRKNKDIWSSKLLDGHSEMLKGAHVVLNTNVDGAEEFLFIRVGIEKNRKSILSNMLSRGVPRYEKHLFRYTREPLGISSEMLKYNENLILKNSHVHSYLLGDRFVFTQTDIEPSYADIENGFKKARDKALDEISRKYEGIIENEADIFVKQREPDLKAKCDKELNDYERELDRTIEEDAEKNTDSEVKAAYAKDITEPIKKRYESQIKSLEKKIDDLTKSSKKEKKEEKLQKIENDLNESLAKLKEVKENLSLELEEATRITPIISYYKERNEQRVSNKRKSLIISMQGEMSSIKDTRKKQLAKQYEADINKEKADKESELRERADKEISDRRENETIRRYEIYFRPENPNHSLKEIKKDIDSINAKYLTYDNRAERAKIERQEKALQSFLGGYVKNPYLASYLFDPQILSTVNREIKGEPEWCLSTLNDSQKKAVRRALASESIFLLQGPPGTGKTQVIAELTAQYAKQGKKVLISSETHKAIDNVFERLPKIPEIRPLRLISSHNGKETSYSPEKLVDNLYLNIQENLLRQINKYENFNQTKDSFSKEMDKLRGDYNKLLDLKKQNAIIEKERSALIKKINQANDKISELTEEKESVENEITSLERAMECVKSYRFKREGATLFYLERFARACNAELSKHECFKDMTYENIHDIVSVDISAIEKEVSSIFENDNIAILKARLKEIQNEMIMLMDEDGALDEGTEAYNKLLSKREEKKKITEEIKAYESGSTNANALNELSKIVSMQVIGSKELCGKVPEQLKSLIFGIKNIVSSICDNIEKEIADYDAIINSKNLNIIDKQKEISQNKQAYEDISNSEGIVEYSDLSSDLKRKIGEFFRDFDINQEYKSGDIEEALLIISNEWRRLERDFESTKLANQEKIPMFKDICKYLDSPDILEDDRCAYTKKIYENVNVFGITCTSREQFKSEHNEELKKYGIDNVNIRTQGIDVVIIDEVSKSSFLDILIPILYGKTVILVGDHRQLHPMYDLKHMRNEDFEGLNESIINKHINDMYTKLYEECFFKTLYENVPMDFKVMLNKQYRSHSHIMEVFNHFYGGNENGLKLGKKQQDDEKQHNLSAYFNNRRVIDPEHHIYFVDCDEKEEKAETDSTSKINKQEKDVVVKLLEGLDLASLELQKNGKIKLDSTRRGIDERPSIGVICTYGDQARLIKREIKNRQYKGFSGKSDSRLVVSTVDDFQGDERDIIIVSMVRNPKDSNYNADFVKQFERINVALSRARKLLIVVGAKKFLSEQRIELPDLSGNHAFDKHSFPVYSEIIGTINRIGRIFTANDILGDSNG